MFKLIIRTLLRRQAYRLARNTTRDLLNRNRRRF